jgi:hypothetical protein
VAPSPETKGNWRLTHFDSQGFRGHEEYNTEAEARRAAEKTYKLTKTISDEEFSKLASTDKFAAGNELTQFVKKTNSGQKLTEADNKRIDELNRTIQKESLAKYETKLKEWAPRLRELSRVQRTLDDLQCHPRRMTLRSTPERAWWERTD